MVCVEFNYILFYKKRIHFYKMRTKIYLHIAYPLIVMDNCIIGIFVAEATFKITIYKEDYFKKPWNLLDIVIILVNFM